MKVSAIKFRASVVNSKTATKLNIAECLIRLTKMPVAGGNIMEWLEVAQREDKFASDPNLSFLTLPTDLFSRTIHTYDL